MNRNLEREIQNMRINSMESNISALERENVLNPAVFLLFRCFLAFCLLVCGIVFPQMNNVIIPDELRDINTYIAVDYNIDDFKEFVDSMAN